MEQKQKTQENNNNNTTITGISCATLETSQLEMVQKEQENSTNFSVQSKQITKIQVKRDETEYPKQIEVKQQSHKKLIIIFSVISLLLVCLGAGLFFYFSGYKDKNSTLPQKVKLNVQVYSDDNKEELEHEEQVYLNYDDQVMQQEYTNKKEYKRENQAKKLIAAHKNRKRRILQEVEENDEDIYTQTETKEEKVIIHTKFKERKQWKLTITDSSILCIWNQIDQNSQILPQQLSENMEQKEINQQQKNNNTYNYATTDNKTQLNVQQDENGSMTEFELDTFDGETQKLKKIKSQLLSTKPEDPQFGELIKDLNCIEDHKDIQDQVFQKNCLNMEEQEEQAEKEIEEQQNEFDQYVKQFEQKQQNYEEDGEQLAEVDGESHKRYLVGNYVKAAKFLVYYGNWCGPWYGGFTFYNECYDICKNKSFSRCKRCLQPEDSADEACMNHDKCCYDEDQRGDPQPCRWKTQKHSCSCSNEFIQDSKYAYDYGCKWWDWRCWGTAGKHIIVMKNLGCNCKTKVWFKNYNKGYYTWWGTYRSYKWERKTTYSCEKYKYCDQF